MKQEFNFRGEDILINSWKIRALINIFTKFNHYDYIEGCDVYIKNGGGVITFPRPRNLIDYLKRMDELDLYAENISLRIPGLYLERKNE